VDRCLALHAQRASLRSPRTKRAAYPSAHQSVADWATLVGCTSGPTEGASLDLESRLAGAETKVERYEGCRSSAVELWTIRGGGHTPLFQDTWGDTLWGFLSAHAKP
jgi:polyhydroxybutyrate depolymerase